MPIQNKTMLITYSDSLGNNLKDLYDNLEEHFGDAIGGVHLLPFFPSTGDRGFAPVDYDEVDSAFGDWEDVPKFQVEVSHPKEIHLATCSPSIF
ncbi:sucrose phosphorylase [Streptococcus pneumoniae]|nr:sucrose phosphorylase [Streptococcus pneumoniae]VLA45197.1 sucrose phosphorylase [Streptococcus pneumoniae]